MTIRAASIIILTLWAGRYHSDPAIDAAFERHIRKKSDSAQINVKQLPYYTNIIDDIIQS